MTDTVTSTGKADSALDRLLNDELDKFNATATRSSNSPSEWSKRKAWSPVSPGGHGGRRLESE